MEMLQVGERVLRRGLLGSKEFDRFGTVVECYTGVPSVVRPGVDMIAVQWDDQPDRIERGYIQGSGSLHRFIALPPVLIPGVVS
jgi:hypothetical protein